MKRKEKITLNKKVLLREGSVLLISQLLFIIFLFTLLTFTLSAQTNVITNTDQEINHHLFNGDWEKSDSLIDLELAIQTSSLKFNFFKAYNYFYTRYVGNNNPYTRDETIRQVKKYSWQAVLNGEELIESLENNFYI